MNKQVIKCLLEIVFVATFCIVIIKIGDAVIEKKNTKLKEVYEYGNVSISTDNSDVQIDSKRVYYNPNDGNPMAGNIIINPYSIIRNASYGEIDGMEVLGYYLPTRVSESDVLILQLLASSKYENTTFKIVCGNISQEITVGKEEKKVFLPISNVSKIGDFAIQMTEGKRITISGCYLINYGDSYSLEELLTGIY